MAISKSIIYLKNDKIDAFVLDSRNDVNPNNFIYDEKRNALIANIGNNQGVPVIEGVFLKVKVQGVRIEHGVNKIVVIGTLESMASQKESNDSIIKRDDDDEDYKNYDEYNKQLENTENADEKIVAESSNSVSASTSSDEKPKKPKKKFT